jgi:hypothetical protein
MPNIPFQAINWDKIEKTEHPGETGTVISQTIQIGGLRIRKVTYSENYQADHWCQKGHIVHCLKGHLISEMESGEETYVSEGMSYVVSDNESSHRSISVNGAELLIIDGDFLQ